jgi:hypothetical protein
MKKLSLVLLIALCLCALASAHGDMQHVLGTVVAVTGNSVSVKIADGSVKVVAIDAETHFLKGDAPATLKDILVGSRVVIHAHKHGDMLHAAEVKIAPAKSASAKAAAKQP